MSSYVEESLSLIDNLSDRWIAGPPFIDFAGARQRRFNVRKHVLLAEILEERRLPQQLFGLTTGAAQQQRSSRRT